MSKIPLLMTTLTLSLFPVASSYSTENAPWIHDYIVTTPNFPKAGIQFKSYGPLLKDPVAFKKMIAAFAERYREQKIDVIAGLDARGFIFGTALAYELNIPFIMVRKAGKLPGDVEQIDYALEYGKNTLELDRAALKAGERVLVVDDLMATGGTAKAACDLIERLGGTIAEVACMIELTPLGGREKVGHPVFSLITIHVDE